MGKRIELSKDLTLLIDDEGIILEQVVISTDIDVSWGDIMGLTNEEAKLLYKELEKLFND